MRRARAVLGTACATHFVHDGFSDIIYVLLPLWSAEFGLNFAQVGLLKTAYSGGMASGQIPAGLLAERWGEARLLAAGARPAQQHGEHPRVGVFALPHLFEQPAMKSGNSLLVVTRQSEIGRGHHEAIRIPSDGRARQTLQAT